MAIFNYRCHAATSGRHTGDKFEFNWSRFPKASGYPWP